MAWMGSSVSAFCNRADIFDIRRVLLHPALDDAVQTLAIFAHDCPHTFAVEGEHGVVAILRHVPAELNGRFPGQQVLVEELSARGTRHRTIRAHQPQVEAQRLRDGQGESVPAPGTQHDLNAGFMGPSQRLQIGFGDLDIGVQQGAIKVDGNEAYGAGHRINSNRQERLAFSTWHLALSIW